MKNDDLNCPQCDRFYGCYNTIGDEPIIMLLENYERVKGCYLRPNKPRVNPNHQERKKTGTEREKGKLPEGKHVPDDITSWSDDQFKAWTEALREESKGTKRTIRVVAHAELVRETDLPANLICRHCGHNFPLPALRVEGKI